MLEFFHRERNEELSPRNWSAAYARQLINIARGEEVHEGALLDALVRGSIRGAVLDVPERELTGRQPRPDRRAGAQGRLRGHESSSFVARPRVI